MNAGVIDDGRVLWTSGRVTEKFNKLDDGIFESPLLHFNFSKIDKKLKWSNNPTNFLIFKIHVRRAAAEDILKFTCICVCLCMYLFIYVFVCVTSPGHTNNDTDLKFGTHTPIDLI